MAKRRANGEGSIRKRKDGRWEGRYTAGRDPVTGKVIYKNVLGKTQAEVKAKLKAAIEKSNSLVAVTKCYTVGQWLDAWMENYAKLQVRPSSHKTYQGFIENHIKPTLGDILLEKLTANQAISVTGLTEHTQDYAGGFPRRGAGETGGKGAVRIEGLLFTRRRLWSERGWNALPGI